MDAQPGKGAAAGELLVGAGREVVWVAARGVGTLEADEVVGVGGAD